MHRALGSVPSTIKKKGKEKQNGEGRKGLFISRDRVHQLSPSAGRLPKAGASEQGPAELRNEVGFLQPCLDVKPIRSLWLNHSPQHYRLVTGKDMCKPVRTEVESSQ